MNVKLLKEGNIVDVIKEPMFVTYQKKNNAFILNNGTKNADGIVSSDSNLIYKLPEGTVFTNYSGGYIDEMIEINDEEYETLRKQLDDEKKAKEEAEIEQARQEGYEQALLDLAETTE